MDSDSHSQDWRSQLRETLPQLERALKTADSEYEKDKEVLVERLERRHKRRKEALQQAINNVQTALGRSGDSKSVLEEGDLSLTGELPSTIVHPNGSEKEILAPLSEQTGSATERFSVRREIEKMISELEPEQEITQGEIRDELERRFPEHKASLRPATVSSALRRIANSDDGTLVLVSKGSGSEPNRYRKREAQHAGGQEEQEETLLRSDP